MSLTGNLPIIVGSTKLITGSDLKISLDAFEPIWSQSTVVNRGRIEARIRITAAGKIEDSIQSAANSAVVTFFREGESIGCHPEIRTLAQNHHTNVALVAHAILYNLRITPLTSSTTDYGLLHIATQRSYPSATTVDAAFVRNVFTSFAPLIQGICAPCSADKVEPVTLPTTATTYANFYATTPTINSLILYKSSNKYYYAYVRPPEELVMSSTFIKIDVGSLGRNKQVNLNSGTLFAI